LGQAGPGAAVKDLSSNQARLHISESRMTLRVPPDVELLRAACKMANMELDDHRLEQLLPDVTMFFQLLDALHSQDSAETPPSATFQARWIAHKHG